jgi:hypothetical protein
LVSGANGEEEWNVQLGQPIGTVIGTPSELVSMWLLVLAANRAWQLGLGADVTFYSKPSELDSSYRKNPVSFQIFLRMRPGRAEHSRAEHSH